MDGLDAASVGEAVAACPARRGRPPDDRDQPGHAGKPDIKHMDRWFAADQPAAHRGHRPPAGRCRGDRRVPRRRPELRELERASAQGGWVKTEDDPLDPLRGQRGAAGRGSDPSPRGRRPRRGRSGPALRRALRARRHRRPGRAGAQAAVPARRQRHRLLLLGARGRRGERHACWRSSRRRRACSTSSTTSRPRPASGCRTWRSARGAKQPMRVPAWLARLLAGEGGGDDDDARGAASPTPRPSGSSAGSCATRRGGRASGKGWRDADR